MSVYYKYGREFYTCSICLSDEYSNKSQLPLQFACGHVFHRSCIKDLFQYNKQKQPCPNCRQDMILKRVSFEILNGFKQIFLLIEAHSIREKMIAWINQDSTFKDLLYQIRINKKDYSQNFIIKTPLGKVISYDSETKNKLLYDYSITPQQTYILRFIIINQQNNQN